MIIKPIIGKIDKDSPEINAIWIATYASKYAWCEEVEKAIKVANKAVEGLLKYQDEADEKKVTLGLE